MTDFAQLSLIYFYIKEHNFSYSFTAFIFSNLFVSLFSTISINVNDFLIFMSRIHHSTRLPNVHFKINLTLLLHSMAFSTILEPQGFSVFSDSTCFPVFFIL